MSVHYRIYQNKNKKSGGYQQFYGRAVSLGTVSTAELAEEIQQNASVKRSDVLAVLSEMSDVVRAKLINGYRVKLDGIGALKAVIASKGAPKMADYTAAQHVKAVNISFQPEVSVDRASGKRVRTLLRGCTVSELPVNLNEKKKAAPAADGGEGGEG